MTEALQRTLGLMQGELERSVLSHQMLGIYLNLITAKRHQETLIFN